jgi:moderate conductance mechanosensitive channel
VSLFQRTRPLLADGVWVIDWPRVAAALLQILAALLVVWIAYRLLGIFVRRMERSVEHPDGSPLGIGEQRVKTLAGLVRTVGVVFVLLIAFFMVLDGLGVNIGPLLAGAGVIGLAFSFGAQSLVKDVISGLFILFENQYGVGDVVRIGEAGGMVEKMTLRVVVLRDLQGAVHIIPNGSINTVTNLTRTWSRAVLEIGVDYGEDVDRVMEVMREIGREFQEDPEWSPLLVEEITVPGIESFGESAVVIRMVAKTLPLKQWEAARELRRRIKKRFDAEGIVIPFPQRTISYAQKESVE